MGSTKNAATHIGRIGGLAVALGVGAAIASGAGAAWADSTDSAPSQSQTSDNKAESKAESKTASTSDATDDRSSTKDTAAEDDTEDSTAESDDTSSAKSEAADKAEKKPSSRSERDDEDDADANDDDADADADAKSAPEPAAKTSEDSETTDTPDDSEDRSTALATTVAASQSPRAETEATEAPEEPASPSVTPALTHMLSWIRKETARHSTVTPSTTTSSANAVPTAAAVVDPLPSRLPSRLVDWVTGPGITNNPTSPGNFNIYGTDLGIMWDGGTIDGQRFVHLAFGDTFSRPNMNANGWRNNVLLLSFDNKLSNGLGLAQTGPAFQFIDRSTTQVGLFGGEVTVIPTAGIHINGTQYVNYMSVRSWDTPGRWTTNYSAISQFYPGSGGGDWRIVPSTIRSSGWLRSSTPYRAGDQNFQQMAYVLQPEDQVAEGEPRYLYAFGTPSGRAGSAYLSRVAEGSVTDLSKYDYWDGNKWVRGNAAVAKPVIGSNRSSGLFGFVVDWANDPNVFGGYLGGLFGPKTGGNVSEMSVQYNEYLGKYVVLYGDGNNNIQMRVADTPEAAWSDPIQLASSAQHPGLYAPMIHPWSGTGLLQNSSGGSDRNNLYWNMSLWGPYNVVLMQTDLSPLRPVEV